MIVVVGQPSYAETDAGPVAGGIGVRIAIAAAAQGRVVQLVGKVGEDDAGDAVVLDLAKLGVGHVAVLRDAGRPTAHMRVPFDAIEGGDLAGSFADDRASGPGESAGPVLDAADVDLALRYLTEFGVIVLTDSEDAEIVRAVGQAAGWVDAQLIVVVPAGEPEPAGLPADSIVFEAPETDADWVFATMVGSFAAALDDGDDPADAFRSTVAAAGWMPSPEDDELEAGT